MRAAAGVAGARLALLGALLFACGGRTDMCVPVATDGCGGGSPTDPLVVPQAAHELCDELFALYDGCGRHDREVCLAAWQTDDICDEEEEAFLDCLLHGAGYVCNQGVFLIVADDCQPLARAVDDCHDAGE